MWHNCQPIKSKDDVLLAKSFGFFLNQWLKVCAIISCFQFKFISDRKTFDKLLKQIEKYFLKRREK